MGDAVAQGDRQGRIGPEQGGFMVAPENRIRTEWSVTTSYGQMEMMDVQEARLQGLRASGFREEVPQSIKWTGREKSCWHRLEQRRKREMQD